MKRLCGLVLALLLVASPAYADFAEGFAAYERGDYATALAEFRPLADQGYANAQFNLGLMYANGRGVPQDHVLAHMWFSLAGVGGLESSAKARDLTAKLMTREQIAEAQRLARVWKPTK